MAAHDGGATPEEAYENFQRKSISQALDEAFGQFFSEVDLKDLPTEASGGRALQETQATPELI